MIRTYDEFAQEMRQRDRSVGLSLAALRRVKGDNVLAVAEEILAFVAHREIDDPVGLYLERVHGLQELQKAWEDPSYPRPRSYAEVKPISVETYNLALLLSFVATIHRFEILQSLKAFFEESSRGPCSLLSVGAGTGYELKLAGACLSGGPILGFDNNPQTVAYARDLLRFFGQDAGVIRDETFPLEDGAGPREDGAGSLEDGGGIEAFAGRFGKIVLCETLEHLERPEAALSNLKIALHPEGQMFLTMAINIAQEDHIYPYESPTQARQQVLGAGLRIVHEFVTPVTIMPFAEKDRQAVFDKAGRGNYVCVAAHA